MNINHLLEEEERIKAAIKREYVGPPDALPIDDGIVNRQQYIESSPRVLWILKEPYCDGDTRTGGGWSMSQLLNEETDRMSRGKAFKPICYINYGIWTGVHDWNKMPYLKDCEEIRNGLKRIAFINVSKLPGLTSSPSARIEAAYRKHRDLILDQIKTYEPNIIFACNPHVNLLLQDLGFSPSQWTWFRSAASVRITTDRRLVSVGHPSRKKELPYVNDAIEAATADITVSEKAQIS